MKLLNITVDQLIADLNVARGKEPFIGTYFLQDASVNDGKIRLSFVENEKAKEGYSIVIGGAEWEGHEFDAELKKDDLGLDPEDTEGVLKFVRTALVKILEQLVAYEPEKEPAKHTTDDISSHIANIEKVCALLEKY